MHFFPKFFQNSAIQTKLTAKSIHYPQKNINEYDPPGKVDQEGRI